MRDPPPGPLDDTDPHPLVDAADATALPHGFGRYVVRGELGSGPLGVVYRAYDPELAREIALKVLRVNQAGDPAERLLREAQALARIRHPNVITVYDVGTVDAHVFVAMELIAGVTLAEWRRRRARSAGDVLRVLGAAGEGLRAAHAAGIAHRDFKAENVLVGDDGRVYVTDFGLAGSRGAEEALADATRADQFSFCVTLFESLYGTAPDDGAGPEAAERRERRLRSGAPAAARRVLRRGLAPAPEARFGDMGELLRALAPRRRWRRLGLAALAIGATTAALLAVPRLRAREQIDRCRQAERKIATLWSAPRQEQLRAALVLAQSGDAFAVAKSTLDRWMHDWTQLHGETCVLGARSDGDSQSLADLRMECLNQRWQDVSATLELLTTQPKTAKHATTAIARLPPIEPCADVAELRRQPRITATAAQLAPLDASLARARADFAVENCPEALAEATGALAQAHALQALALEADARTLIGLSQMCLGERDAARVSFMDTVVLAEQAQDDRRVVTGYLQLINTAADLAQYDDAEHWLVRVREALRRTDAPLKLQAEVAYNECYVPLMRGRNAEAEPYCRRSRQLFAQLPTRTTMEADAAEQLGQLLGRQGKFAEAVAAYRDAQRLYRELKGPDSSGELRVLEALADDETEQDHIAAALSLQQRVVEHGNGAFPDQLVIDLTFYGNLLVESGRARESLPVFARALAAAETIKSDHGFETGIARAGLGSAYVALGQPEVAVGYLELAKRLISPDGNEDVVASLDVDLAKALWSATPHHGRALGLANKARDYLRAHPLGALRARHLRELDAWLATREKKP